MYYSIRQSTVFGLLNGVSESIDGDVNASAQFIVRNQRFTFSVSPVAGHSATARHGEPGASLRHIPASMGNW